MPEHRKEDHADDFTLLRLAAGETSAFESRRVRRHVEACARCETALRELTVLDSALRRARPEDFFPGGQELPPRDSFRQRPVVTRGRVPRPEGDLFGLAASASREAEPVATGLVNAALSSREAGRTALADLRLEAPRDRFALGSSLQEGTRRMVEGPQLWLRFAEGSIERLEALPAPSARRPNLAEALYPAPDLAGRAHVLAGNALNWAGRFDSAGSQLRKAYLRFAQGSASEASFAEVELNESQRRTFSERPSEGLLLARRAVATFGELGLADFVARARVAEGLALSYLNREEDAVKAYDTALAAFARLSLWNGWLSALNNLTSSLVALGRGDAARRELARALKKTSRAERPALHAYLLQNLGRLLLDADRPAEARRSFRSAADLFASEGDLAAFATSSLLEVEALARVGRFREARARLDEVRARTGAVADLAAFEDALRESRSGLESLRTLREDATRGVLRMIRSETSKK